MKKRLIVKLPNQYFYRELESVKLFYDLLIGVLKDHKKKPIVLKPKNYLLFRVLRGVKFSYHTIDPKYINIKIAYLPEYFYFHRSGYSGFNNLAAQENLYNYNYTEEKQKWFNEISHQIISTNQSKYDQPEIVNEIKLPKKYLVLFTQVSDDTVSKLFPYTWPTFIKKIAKIVVEKGYSLVIKRHPKCNDTRIEEALEQVKVLNPQKVLIRDYSIHTLISNSEGVIVGNSGTGFEALFHLKPVFTFGESDYKYATYPMELNDFINNMDGIIQGFGNQKKKEIIGFVYYFLNDYLVKCTKSSIQKRLKDLNVIN